MSRHRRQISALFTVFHESYSGSSEDAHGNTIDSWSAPSEKRFVTIQQPSSDEPDLQANAGFVRDVAELGLVVLPDFGAVSARDRMTVDGVTYEVVGRPEGFVHNPFNAEFGCLVINLKVVSS